MVGQENPSSDSSANKVLKTVPRVVIVFVSVVVEVIVSAGWQESALRWGGLLEVIGVGLAVVMVVLLPVLGGMYESEQSVSSSSVAFALLVTVRGGQVKSGCSDDSGVSVMVTVVVFVVVKSSVAVITSVADRGQAEQ